jgi:hypothetical protein
VTDDRQVEAFFFGSHRGLTEGGLGEPVAKGIAGLVQVAPRGQARLTLRFLAAPAQPAHNN